MKTLQYITKQEITATSPRADFPGGGGSACYIDLPVQRGDIVLLSSASSGLGGANGVRAGSPNNFWAAEKPHFCGNGWNGAVVTHADYFYTFGVTASLLGHFNFQGQFNHPVHFHTLAFYWVRSAGVMRAFMQYWNTGTSPGTGSMNPYGSVGIVLRPNEALSNLGCWFAAASRGGDYHSMAPMIGENAYTVSKTPIGAKAVQVPNSYNMGFLPETDLVVSAGDYLAVLQSNPYAVGQPGHGPMLDAVCGGTSQVSRVLLHEPNGRWGGGVLLELFKVDVGGTFTAKGLTPTVLQLMAQGDPAAMTPISPSGGFVLV